MDQLQVCVLTCIPTFVLPSFISWHSIWHRANHSSGIWSEFYLAKLLAFCLPQLLASYLGITAGNLSGGLSGTLLGKYSGSLSGVHSNILSSIYSDILSGGGTASRSSQLRSGGNTTN